MLLVMLANMLILAHAVVPHHHQQLQGLPSPTGRTGYQAIEGKDDSPKI